MRLLDVKGDLNYIRISYISFIALLFTILNIFDLWYLSSATLRLDINIIQIFLVLLVGFVIYAYLKKMTPLQSKIFFFWVVYLVLQFFNSINSSSDILSSLSVLIMLLFSSYVAFTIRNYQNDFLYDITLYTTKYTILSMIVFDIANDLMAGNSLFMLFQNNAPLILMTLVILHYYSNNKKTKSFLFRLFLIYVLWTLISYSLGNGYLRLQYKSLTILALILFSLFIIIKFKYIVPLMNTKFMLRYFVPISFLIVVIILFFSISYGYDFIIEYIPRRGSGETRIAVAEVMFMDTVQNLFFGYGLGSSNHTYLINNNQLVGPHSGLMIQFYEQGIFGSFMLFFFGLSFFVRKKIIIYWNKYRRGHSFFFLILVALVWIVQNIVYIIGYPAAVIFHQSQIISYILLATFLSNQLFISKGKY